MINNIVQAFLFVFIYTYIKRFFNKKYILHFLIRNTQNGNGQKKKRNVFNIIYIFSMLYIMTKFQSNLLSFNNLPLQRGILNPHFKVFQCA